MQRVNRSSAVASLPAAPTGGAPGYFTGGNPGLGQPATVPGYEWFNAVQEEMIGMLTRAGITPAQGDLTQLRQSLDRLYGGALRTVAANITLTADDAGLVLVDAASGGRTITLPAANAASGRPLRITLVRLDGTANGVSIVRVGSDLIDGLTAVALAPNQRVTLVSDGASAWRYVTPTVPGAAYYNAPGTYSFVVPAGVFFVRSRLWGGGGGGGSAGGTAAAACGGQGGAYSERLCSVIPNQSISVTVGAGGTAGAGGGGNGGPGGTTSFGSFHSAQGGAGGPGTSAGTANFGSAPVNNGVGGDINLGAQGPSGGYVLGTTYLGSAGTGAPFGGAPSFIAVGQPTVGSFPGGGASGASSNGTGFLGAPGASGACFLTWG